MPGKKTKSVLIALVCLLIAAVICLTVYLLTPRNPYVNLPYEKAPYENPLRGLVYMDQTELPQSLIYMMVPFNDFYDESGKISFDRFEDSLKTKTEKGSQAVVRVFASYPGDENKDFTGLYLPPHMYNELKSRNSIFSQTNDEGIKFELPDFGDEYLLEQMTLFIKEFGRKYDNDPRIGFIQLGLIGRWGEWNFYPFDEQMTLTTEKCNVIYKAYQDAFPTTKLMARNPLMGDSARYKIGFHDDNFLYNTVSLEPVTEENINHIAQFQYMMIKSGTEDTWKTQAYGGELSGATQHLFYEGTGYDYFKKSIEIFHFSYISLPIPQSPAEDYEKAMEATRMIGYELTADKVRITRKSDRLAINLSLTNTGYAPFYYNWDFEIRAVDKSGNVKGVYPLTGQIINDILPGESKAFGFIIENADMRGCEIQFAIISPMREIAGKNYKPLYLANKDQAGDGFIKLGYVK